MHDGCVQLYSWAQHIFSTSTHNTFEKKAHKKKYAHIHIRHVPWERMPNTGCPKKINQRKTL